MKSLSEALLRLGEPERAVGDLRRWIGPPFREALAQLLETDDAVRIERAVELYRERFGRVGLYENRVYPGIPECLDALREAGWELHVVTSKPHVYARRVLDHFDLARHFGEVFGAELSGERSRKDELVAHALATLGAAPPTWMVGDREYDVAGARANGLEAVGVLWGHGGREELLRAGAAHLVSSPEELRSWGARMAQG